MTSCLVLTLKAVNFVQVYFELVGESDLDEFLMHADNTPKLYHDFALMGGGDECTI